MFKYHNLCFFPYGMIELYKKNGTWPDDGVDIDDVDAFEYIQPPPDGKKLGVDANGYPQWIDVSPPSLDEKAASMRSIRDAELAKSSWLVERHRDELEHLTATTLIAEQYTELQTYRQQLRDWPVQPGWPDIEMPTPPDWLALL